MAKNSNLSLPEQNKQLDDIVYSRTFVGVVVIMNYAQDLIKS
jgi:hypothetical protein